MPMPAGNVIIIALSLLAVISGGLWVFFWWRGKYGVWAREREARAREQGQQNVTIIAQPKDAWTATPPTPASPQTGRTGGSPTSDTPASGTHTGG